MKHYRIVLPNDYNSEADSELLQADFPELAGDDLVTAAFERIRDLWPVSYDEQLDFGWTASAETPPPDTLPQWAWVSEEVPTHA
jgi:hypothetical protein